MLCTICARGGSKGVKNKNIKVISGLPLIAHSIIQAQKTNLFEVIAVSSDSPEILAVAKVYGAQVLITRPAELATDTAAKVPVIRHCVTATEKFLNKTFDVIVDIDCTSPLRLPEDIVGSVDLLSKTNCQNVITGSPSHRSPYFNLVELDVNERATLSKTLDKSIVRRQDAPRCYDMNASIYVWKREALMSFDGVLLEDTRLFEMPPERSQDIDSEIDFEIVEFFGRKRGYLS